MQSFDFKDVSLHDGPLKKVLDDTMTFYLNLPNDNILKYMRESAGKPAPGLYYTGWYPNSRGIALIGQWLSAFARLYAVSGNEAFREKAVFVAAEFWDCYGAAQDTAPFLTTRSHYSLEKLLRAHCDLHTYCAYPDAKKYADYLVAFAREHHTTDNLFGNNSTEWYTVSESYYKAAEVFGNETALTLARQYEYREFWDLFYQDADPFSKRPVAGLYSEFCHAYSHVNSFNSCAKAYEQTRDPYYLKALLSFYRFMQSEEVMVTGGYGANFEHLMPKYRLIDALRTGHDSFETQCDSYAAYRLVKYLTCLTGGAEYGNWAEALFYNATAATPPMTAEGNVLYYSDYNMYGGKKKNRADGWTCCTGTRPLLAAELSRLIYFADEKGLYISQYTPSALRWEYGGQVITVDQQTAFPTDDVTELSVRMAHPADFTISFRLPAWLAGPVKVCLNGRGEPLKTTVDQNGWLGITRVWEDGDLLRLTLPQEVRMHSLDAVKKGPNAFAHGPVVLGAAYTGIQTPNDHCDVRALVPKMRATAQKPLHYTVEGMDNLTFKPFYEFQEDETYFIYHDTTAHATRFNNSVE